MEVAVTTGAISRTKLQSNHHQQTNTQLFYRPDALPVARPTVSKHWREKYHMDSIDLLTPTSPGDLPTFVSDHWLPWGGLPRLSSALWCQYPSCSVESSVWWLRLCCAAVHHGRHLTSRTAPGAGGVLHRAHDAVPRPERSGRRAGLHILLNRTLRRERPLNHSDNNFWRWELHWLF